MKLLTDMSVALAWALVPVSWQKGAISCSSQAKLTLSRGGKVGRENRELHTVRSVTRAVLVKVQR